VTTDHDVRAQLASVREQADAVAALARLTDERRREAVLAARAAGMTLTAIAQQLGLSHGRVTQIINNTR
jgi:DNA-directed RNA polymerase specialized sigma24 family protein